VLKMHLVQRQSTPAFNAFCPSLAGLALVLLWLELRQQQAYPFLNLRRSIGRRNECRGISQPSHSLLRFSD
jgi:hypothetical protein